LSFVVGLSSFLVVIGFLFSLCLSPSRSDWRQISDSGSQVFRWSDSDSAGDEFEPVHIVEPRDEPVEGAEDGAGVQDAGVVAAGLSLAPPLDSPWLNSGSGVFPSRSDWRQISDSDSQVFRWSDSDSAGDESEPVHIVEPRDETVEGAEDGAGVQDAGVVAAGLSSAPPSDSPRLDSGSGVQMILVALSKVSHSPIFPVPVLRSLRRMWY